MKYDELLDATKDIQEQNAFVFLSSMKYGTLFTSKPTFQMQLFQNSKFIF